MSKLSDDIKSAARFDSELGTARAAKGYLCTLRDLLTPPLLTNSDEALCGLLVDVINATSGELLVALADDDSRDAKE